MKPDRPVEDARKGGLVEHWCAICGSDEACRGIGYFSPAEPGQWFCRGCLPAEFMRGSERGGYWLASTERRMVWRYGLQRSATAEAGDLAAWNKLGE